MSREISQALTGASVCLRFCGRTQKGEQSLLSSVVLGDLGWRHDNCADKDKEKEGCESDRGCGAPAWGQNLRVSLDEYGRWFLRHTLK